MKQPETFCILPFTSMYVHSDGHVTSCCHGTKLFEVAEGQEPVYMHKDTLAGAFRSPTLLKLRENLLKGVRDANCENCWRNESLGQRSPRQIENDIFSEEAAAVLKGEIPDQPIHLNVSPGNLCNLKCRICRPGSSSKWTMEAEAVYGDDLIPRPDYLKSMPREDSRNLLMNWPETNQEFWETLERWVPKIKLFNFTGGEPFLSVRHFEVLEKSVKLGSAPNQTLRYNTNGSVFPTKAYTDIFPHFRHVQVLFSLDGTGRRFEYQRAGARWEDVLANLEKFRALPNVFTGVCMTVSAINMYYLLDELDFWLEKGVPVYLNLLTDPLHFNATIMPRHLKAALRKRLYAGDLRKYDKILMNKLEPVIEFLLSDGNESHWPEFSRHIELHDKYRGESFAAVFPEYAKLIQGKRGFASLFSRVFSRANAFMGCVITGAFPCLL